MHKTIIFFMLLMSLALSDCGSFPNAPATGTMEGKIYFSYANTHSTLLPCQVSEYSKDTSVNTASIDWSGLISEGWSFTEGFIWQGDVHAPGFICTVNPHLKYQFRNDISAGSEEEFFLYNVLAGNYSFVVIINYKSRELVHGEDGVPIVIELNSKHGVDIGLLTIEGK
jgi:hypothetical protein